MPRNYSGRDYTNVTVTCSRCATVFPRRAPNHKLCDACAKQRQLEVNREYHAKNREKRRLQRQEPAVRERINASKRARYAETAEYRRAYQKAWTAANRDKLAMQRRARVYGMSIEELDAILAGQGNACPICEKPIEGSFHVDHDHATGAVRGILHGACNKGLGMLADDAGRCDRAAAYLRGGFAALRLVA